MSILETLLLRADDQSLLLAADLLRTGQLVAFPWKKALLPNGVAAVSFNTLTFPTEQVISIVRSSGFTPVEGGLFGSLRHEVEQAVVRDVVFMINKPLEGGT